MPIARSYSAWIERVVELLPKNVHFEDVSPRFWRMHFGWGESPRDAVAAALQDVSDNRVRSAGRRNRCGCNTNRAQGRVVPKQRGAWAHVPENIRAGFRGPTAPTRSEMLPKSFESPHGRVFTLGPREKRGSGHEAAGFNGHVYPIFFQGKQAGQLFWTLSYGLTPTGRPMWSASTREIVWSGDGLPPTGLGFDVGPEPTAKATLARWARNVDDVLDWRAGKPVRSIYAGGRAHRESGQPAGIFQRSR